MHEWGYRHDVIVFVSFNLDIDPIALKFGNFRQDRYCMIVTFIKGNLVLKRDNRIMILSSLGVSDCHKPYHL